MTAPPPPAPWWTRHQLRALHNAVLHLPASGDLRNLRTDPQARQLVHQTRALRAAWAHHLGWRAEWTPAEQAGGVRLNDALHRTTRLLDGLDATDTPSTVTVADVRLLADAAAESRWRLNPW